MSNTHTTILEVLRARAGEWCGPQMLAGHAFAGLAEVADAVASLRLAGYNIEDHPRLGYRFTGGAGRLLPYEITRGLGATIIGRRILAYDRVASTNDLAWSQAAAGAEEGTVVCAEEQTAGRGRMGRQWTCPRGKGLLFSIILRPKLDIDRQSVLTIMAAVATARALHEDYQLPALIRWPNDILIRDRKIGGILVEVRTIKGRPNFVLGLGLNTNISEQEFPPGLRTAATSVAIESRRDVDRIACARSVLRSLDRWYAVTLRGEYGLIAEQWRQLSSNLGRRITLTDNAHEYTGRVLDLSLEDGLILHLDGGGARVFPAGQFALKLNPPDSDTPAS